MNINVRTVEYHKNVYNFENAVRIFDKVQGSIRVLFSFELSKCDVSQHPNFKLTTYVYL